jgi:hypothetical protein
MIDQHKSFDKPARLDNRDTVVAVAADWVEHKAKDWHKRRAVVG